MYIITWNNGTRSSRTMTIIRLIKQKLYLNISKKSNIFYDKIYITTIRKDHINAKLFATIIN